MAALAARSGSTVRKAAGTAAAVLGSLTIPGRPEQVRQVRSFVREALREHSAADVAVLLASEIVTNAILHSESRRPGGIVTVAIFEIAGGLRIEVADAGSTVSTPEVRGDLYASQGHGLFLVQSLADQWGYLQDEFGTTVWFWLTPPE